MQCTIQLNLVISNHLLAILIGKYQNGLSKISNIVEELNLDLFVSEYEFNKQIGKFAPFKG